MKIAIYGAGGVGGYFGGRLAQSGHEVMFVARGAHLEAMERDGLQVTSPKGDFTIKPVVAASDPSSFGVVDLVLLGVKAGQVSDIAPTLAPLVGAETVIVPLQNGVEAADDVIASTGPEAVVGGLCRIVTSLTAPGHIAHAGLEPTIVIGELDGSTSARVSRVRDTLTQAGIAVEVPDDIRVALWKKLLLIAPWGGLGSLTRVTLDVLCHTPETRRLLHRAMSEVQALAVARGADVPVNAVDETLEFLASVPAGGTASMQRDIMDGRPSELHSQVGVIVRLGQQEQVETTVNTFIYECLLPGEQIARGEIEVHHAQS